MSKSLINVQIRNLKKAGLATKVSEWMFEGLAEKKYEVKYVGIKVDEDWREIISSKNNLLVKFLANSKEEWVEIYLANKPPFVKLSREKISAKSKWENWLGELRRNLKKDKDDLVHHRDKVGNLYGKIKGGVR